LLDKKREKLMTQTPNNPLSYTGINEREQPRFLSFNRAPTTNDKFFPGTQWEDSKTNTIYITTGDGVWASISSSGIATLTGNTGGALSPTAGNINVVGSGSVSVAGSAATLTISGKAGLTWNDAATTTTMKTNNGYIVTKGAQVFTLPKASSVGDTIEILLNGGTSWSVAQAAGQSVLVSESNTTVGVGGSVTSTDAGQAIKMTCVTANTKWQATSLIGNPKVV
jgi:hypothetical protein